MKRTGVLRSSFRGLWPGVLLTLPVLSTGCSMNPFASSTSPVVAKAQPLVGKVYGGQQPVVGASIQLYAAGTPTSGGGYGVGATGLIALPLPTSDANGGFVITGDYTVPSAASHFYLVASGGSPGGGTPVNPNLVLMAAIGGCTATVGLSPSLFLNVNEVTTAASVMALQPFIANPAAGNLSTPLIGAPSSASNALQNAFETANNLVNNASGAVVTPADNWSATTENGLRLNTIGNILASCVNSDPSQSASCSTLFSDATPSAATYTAGDTVQAATLIAQNPAHNVSQLFLLGQANPPFVGLSSAPADFTVPVATSGAACQSPVTLGTAANFELLAGSTITNTGSSLITGGNVGLSPGTVVTGFTAANLTPPAVIEAADAAAAQGQTDLTTAYNSVAGLAGAAVLPADLGGLTLPPGLYATTSTAGLSSNVTLDAQGDPGAVFIFQVGTTLTTAGSTQVLLVHGATASHVFWEIGSTATLGMNSVFVGTILSGSSITLNSGASLQGRALAESGAISLTSNPVTAP